MNMQSSASIHLIPRLRAGALVGGLLLSLLGCGRSAVVMTPENSSPPEESANAKPVARAQTDEAPSEKLLARAGADEPASKKPVARAAKNESQAAPFRFPEDGGGRLLAKVLPPKDAEPARLQPISPLPPRPSAPSATSAYEKLPALPLPPASTALPRLPGETRVVSLHPTLVLDETLGALPEAPALPQAPSLPQRRRVRVPSLDVNEPIPLPILAQPVSDRVSLDDPTLDASAAAAIAAPIPPRTSKAPFLKLTLPDPYDRRRTEVTASEESKEFPLGTPQRP
jgi:hypothetical protein